MRVEGAGPGPGPCVVIGDSRRDTLHAARGEGAPGFNVGLGRSGCRRRDKLLVRTLGQSRMLFVEPLSRIMDLAAALGQGPAGETTDQWSPPRRVMHTF